MGAIFDIWIMGISHFFSFGSDCLERCMERSQRGFWNLQSIGGLVPLGAASSVFNTNCSGQPRKGLFFYF